MSNIPDSIPSTPIQLEEVTFRFGIPSEFFQKMGGYLNYLLNNVNLAAVGSFKSAFLTETQFRSQMGSTWVLADGRDVTGSAYATLTGNTNIPDCRAMLLISKVNGRVGKGVENAVGFQLPDEMLDHSHGVSVFYNGTCKLDSVNPFVPIGSGTFPVGNPSGLASNINVQYNPGNETRARNVTLNHFIKIN